MMIIQLPQVMKISAAKKRVVIRKGDVFCVILSNCKKAFFQYVEDDKTQLNSSVIKVFRQIYEEDYLPDLERIVQDEVLFYAHTMLRVGLKQGIWEKVGNVKQKEELEIYKFRLFEEINFSQITKSYSWYIWEINSPVLFIGELSNEYKVYELGFVFSPFNILYRVENGTYDMKMIE